MGTRKRIKIEDFLRWAYRDELPKAQADGTTVGPAGFGGAWGGTQQAGELGTLVDFAHENRFGVVPDRFARDDPHPDAVRAALAVEALDGLEAGFDSDWNPIADLPDLGPLGLAAVGRARDDLMTTDREGRTGLRGGLRKLVRRHAVLGGCPPWEIEAPEARTVTGPNGKPAWFCREVVDGADGPAEIETNGMDRTRRMPKPGAYRKQELVPDPTEGIIDRGLYELYVMALARLHADLVDRLDTYAIEPSPRPLRPWETGDVAGPTVLQSLTAEPIALPSRAIHARFRSPGEKTADLAARQA